MAGVIPFAGAENDPHVIEFPWVGDVWHIGVGTVEINVVVKVSVKERADIERSTE